MQTHPVFIVQAAPEEKMDLILKQNTEELHRENFEDSEEEAEGDSNVRFMRLAYKSAGGWVQPVTEVLRKVRLIVAHNIWVESQYTYSTHTLSITP